MSAAVRRHRSFASEVKEGVIRQRYPNQSIPEEQVSTRCDVLRFADKPLAGSTKPERMA